MGLKDEGRCCWEAISIIQDNSRSRRPGIDVGYKETDTIAQRMPTDLALFFHLKHAREDIVSGRLALCCRTLKLLRGSHIIGSANE